MTPKEMLEVIGKTKAPLLLPTKVEPVRDCFVCHTPLVVGEAYRCQACIKRDAEFVAKYTPAMRVFDDSCEPWMLEQLLALNCPTCGASLTALQCTIDPLTRFYTCTEVPSHHRWTLKKRGK